MRRSRRRSDLRTRSSPSAYNPFTARTRCTLPGQAIFEGEDMNSDVNTLLQLFFRWAHVVAGITWIGHLYFFNWVNGPFQSKMDGPTKRAVNPELMPRALHPRRRDLRHDHGAERLDDHLAVSEEDPHRVEGREPAAGNRSDRDDRRPPVAA